MLRAKDARAIASKVKPKGLDKILEHISSAAKAGKARVTVNVSLIGGDSSVVVVGLKNLGYKVMCVSDQRDGDYYDIKW